MAVRVRLAGVGPRPTEGCHEVDASDVRSAIQALDAALPGLRAWLCEPSGNLRRSVHILANAEDIRFLDHLDTRLGPDALLEIRATPRRA
jgi:molybdopterin synthase sulfur carrier subunit